MDAESKPYSIEDIRTNPVVPEIASWSEFIKFAESLDDDIGPHFGRDAARVGRYVKELEEQLEVQRELIRDLGSEIASYSAVAEEDCGDSECPDCAYDRKLRALLARVDASNPASSFDSSESAGELIGKRLPSVASGLRGNAGSTPAQPTPEPTVREELRNLTDDELATYIANQATSNPTSRQEA